MPQIADIVENISSLSLEEMEEVEKILHQSIMEMKLKQIYLNKKEADDLYTKEKLKFYDNANDFLNSLNAE